MKMPLSIRFSFNIILALIILYSCKKEEVQLPVLTTSDITQITQTFAISGGIITSEGSSNVIVRGVCWSTSIEPTINDFKSEDGSGIGNFSSNITGLLPKTTYFVRAYATTKFGTSYGMAKSLTTEPATIPIVTTQEVTAITHNSASCGGNITADGGVPVAARGVCWSTRENPNIGNSTTIDGTGVGDFTSNLTDLTPNTNYYVRAYAINSEGTAYGEQRLFSTNKTSPTVTTQEVTAITDQTATCGGYIKVDNGFPVTARGVCWSTKNNPTTQDSKTEDGEGTGYFQSKLTDLTPKTTYYVRAYAINSAGTAYGEQKTFTTIVTPPKVTTGDVTNISTTTATCSGNVTADGGSDVTARGVCWSTSQYPKIANSMTIEGTGLGTYTSNMTSLSPYTLYYVRAYATNAQGTAYGEQKAFYTLYGSDIEYGSFTDSRDGKVYKTLTIGGQTWMAENLAYLPSAYLRGKVSKTEPYCYVYGYFGTDVAAAKAKANYKTYGVLYNWPAAMNGAASSSANPSGVQGMCPDGWHLPSDAEWTQLEICLANNGHNYDGSIGPISGDEVRAKIAKSMASASGWDLSDVPGSVGNTDYPEYRNKSGFTGLPGGIFKGTGEFSRIGRNGSWWNSKEIDKDHAWSRHLLYSSSFVRTGYVAVKSWGYYVRCVKD